MKSILSLSFWVMVLVLLPLTACKKGDNDPFLSLRSRKNRVCGKWKLSKGKLMTSVTDNNVQTSSSRTAVYEEFQVTYTQMPGNTTWKNNRSEILTFDEDGSFTQTIIETPVGSLSNQTQVEGRWAFYGRNDKEELKNQEALSISVTSNTQTTGSTSTYYTDEAPITASIWRLEELRKDKMVVKYKNTVKDSGVFYVTEGDFTYVEN
jgi:hypothetical protein